MKLEAMGKDKGLGLSIQELRDFVAQLDEFPGNEYLDCYIAGDDEDNPPQAPLIGIIATADMKCPRCGRPLRGEPVRHALSRIDSKTHICNQCGNDEAMWDMVRPHEDMPPVDRPCHA